ncbi:hypothetical protein, partial [Yersinia sp. Marseille-Q5920]|uniref:hypothetical protein n=1 Tax=Yersinia sp. Marseille-Q5920 TaxID=2972785 RepID=UPI002264ABC0
SAPEKVLAYFTGRHRVDLAELVAQSVDHIFSMPVLFSGDSPALRRGFYYLKSEPRRLNAVGITHAWRNINA